MNFWKSVFVEEEVQSPSSCPPVSDPEAPSTADSVWSFGGLIKTLATKTESVIENYRRDIGELSSGLLEETSLIRDAAARAVKDLPDSLDAGASVAQESLESVGQAIDDIGSTVWKTTSHFLLGKDEDTDFVPSRFTGNSSIVENRGSADGKYCHFDAQLRGMEGDLSTYCCEPENKEDYDEWRSKSWVLGDSRRDEIDKVFRENEVVREAYNEAVPSRVDSETFWRRYFYHLEKLKKVEATRALLVKKAMSFHTGDDEFSWDLDEENDQKASVSRRDDEEDDASMKKKDSVMQGKVKEIDNGNSSESCKGSDFSIVSNQFVAEDGWDEIEYSGSNDEGNEKRALHMRLRAVEMADDISWDAEEDDEGHPNR